MLLKKSSNKRHKRSSTYEVDPSASNVASPGVQKVVESLTVDMSSEQMRDTLLNAIDERAKKKGVLQ